MSVLVDKVENQLYPRNTPENEPLGVYFCSFFTMKQIVKETVYKETDEKKNKIFIIVM